MKNGHLKEGILEHVEVETYLLHISINIMEVYTKLMDVVKYRDEYNLIIQALSNFVEYLEEKAFDIGTQTT